ncbi:methyltransferase domain-containing protein [Fulvimarina endophytica]|uniref:Protein-L-isoaspartate O-methyltransferase n=1 Tax=Fulvimarina endophytica TaxID=2293836 RepID=A0A371XAV0_9HYPH|nr:methyltransferase domain-containing protein [Fulvimarina endophytica]RFC66365.1 methyltransferase domain-containing protein [Fulvimarina endophytica]
MNDPASDRSRFLARLRADEPSFATRVLEAAALVPREVFLPIRGADPYGYGPLPLDCGETMPDAVTALRLIHALDLSQRHRVLEIGTGSGYGTALIARLALHVTSLERYRRLLARAETALREAGVTNVSLFLADGSEGYAEAAPYDRILVNAAFPALPKHFLDQMGPQSTLVCAIGEGTGEQMLVRLSKVGARFERDDLWPVRYQPIASGIAAAL